MHIYNEVMYILKYKYDMSKKILLCNDTDTSIYNAVRAQCNDKLDFQDLHCSTFSDGEIFSQIINSDIIHNRDIILLHLMPSKSTAINDSVMQLFITLDALRRTHVRNISLIMPYFPYARQDRQLNAGDPISSKFLADTLQILGINKIFTIDIHSNIPIFNCYAKSINPKLSDLNIENCSIKNLSPKDTVFIAPDAGSRHRTRVFMEDEYEICTIDKLRTAPGQSEVRCVGADIKDKHCIIFDDILDGGSTLCKATQYLHDNGAKDIKAFITHGLFSGSCVDKINDSKLTKVYVSDSLRRYNGGSDKISIIPIATKLIIEIINNGTA